MGSVHTNLLTAFPWNIHAITFHTLHIFQNSNSAISEQKLWPTLSICISELYSAYYLGQTECSCTFMTCSNICGRVITAIGNYGCHMPLVYNCLQKQFDNHGQQYIVLSLTMNMCADISHGS